MSGKIAQVRDLRYTEGLFGWSYEVLWTAVDVPCEREFRSTNNHLLAILPKS